MKYFVLTLDYKNKKTFYLQFYQQAFAFMKYVFSYGGIVGDSYIFETVLNFDSIDFEASVVIWVRHKNAFCHIL